MAGVRDEPFRASSVHVSLTPPTITKTLIYTHLIRAKYCYQRFCQLPFHLTRLLSDEYLIPMKETFQTYVFENYSVKNLKYLGHRHHRTSSLSLLDTVMFFISVGSQLLRF